MAALTGCDAASRSQSEGPVWAGSDATRLSGPAADEVIRRAEGWLAEFGEADGAGLARLRHLRRLDASYSLDGVWNTDTVERPEFFPSAAVPLGQLTSLEELDLSGHAPVTGLAPLGTLSRLRYLKINQTNHLPQWHTKM